MAFLLTLTQAGLSAIVNAQAGTVGPVQITQLGVTDTAFTSSSTLETLPGEIKRIDVSGDTLGDEVIHVEALDSSNDTYGYRGFALYSSTGTLFAVFSQAERIAEKAAGSVTAIVVDVAVTKGQADNITFGNTDYSSPPASTDNQGLVEIATEDEAKSGVDALRVITPATAKAAVLSWIGFAPLAASAFTKAAILALLGYVPFDSAGFSKAAILTLLGYTPLDAAAFTKAAILNLLGFTPQDAAASTFGSNANGFWEKRPNGVLDQWGYVAIPSGSNVVSGTITFPIPFTDADPTEIVITGNVIKAPNGSWHAATFMPVPADDSTASFVADTANSTQSFDAGNKASWRAIGRWA